MMLDVPQSFNTKFLAVFFSLALDKISRANGPVFVRWVSKCVSIFSKFHPYMTFRIARFRQFGEGKKMKMYYVQ